MSDTRQNSPDHFNNKEHSSSDPVNSQRPGQDVAPDEEIWDAQRDAADAMLEKPPTLEDEAAQLHVQATQRLAKLTEKADVSFGRQMLQLVLIPAILVAGIMAVWLMVTALSGQAEQVPEILGHLEQTGGGVPGAQERYRSAVSLLSVIQSKDKIKDEDRKLLVQKLPDIAKQYLGKSDDTDRMVLGCLGLLGDPATLPVFDEFLKSDDEGDRFAAVSGLYLWRGSMDELRPMLPEILKAHNMASKSVAAAGDSPSAGYWLRLESISVLGAVAQPGNSDVINALMDDTTDSSGPNRELAWNAGMGLAVLGDPRGIPYVLTLLDRSFLEKQVEDPSKPDGPTMDGVTQQKVLLSAINVVIGSSASVNGHHIRIQDESVWNAIKKLADADPDTNVRHVAQLALDARASDAKKGSATDSESSGDNEKNKPAATPEQHSGG